MDSAVVLAGGNAGHNISARRIHAIALRNGHTRKPGAPRFSPPEARQTQSAAIRDIDALLYSIDGALKSGDTAGAASGSARLAALLASPPVVTALSAQVLAQYRQHLRALSARAPLAVRSTLDRSTAAIAEAQQVGFELLPEARTTALSAVRSAF